MNGFHVLSVSESKVYFMVGKDQQANTPAGSALGVPTEDTFNADNDVFQIGEYQFKKQLKGHNQYQIDLNNLINFWNHVVFYDGVGSI